MKKPDGWTWIDVQKGLFALLGLLLANAAQAFVVSVSCGDVQVGSVTMNTFVNGANAGVKGGFTVTPALGNLGAAAKACGEDRFNWYQVVASDNKPPVDSAGNRLSAPYIDPPMGGYGDEPSTAPDDTQWADNLPYYWDEGADPAAGTPGFANGYNVLDNLVGGDTFATAHTLLFEDSPGGLADTSLFFKTWLASVNADGSLHALYTKFSWGWSNPKGVETVSSLQVPEPGTVALALVGCLASGLARRRWR
ncbi:MAG: PEP-CTERM sorting domain-containing protein [Zoogloea sp.]|uniref:PEP-CTERM sorting domain-containing protein n=1 Tax=Zoogloea sp. TaxID=49181 RepID=UPI00263673A0|nr:PEP-CTERM sorting domain-containing protein [Zoogloea sp.]MDD3328019.1 PEP-CTERM sorting domain-containing protein [Zoogloea sp.]